MKVWQAWYEGWAVFQSFPGHKGRPGQHGGSVPRETLAIQAGGIPVANVLDVDSLPEVLKGLAGKAFYKPQTMTGKVVHAAGLAPKILEDGSLLIPVAAGRKPSRRILIHELVHAHQGQILANDPAGHDTLCRKFEEQALYDNRFVKSPLWAEDMLKNGDEIWTEATGFYYGGNREMVVSASPRVVQLVRDVYEK